MIAALPAALSLEKAGSKSQHCRVFDHGVPKIGMTMIDQCLNKGKLFSDEST